MKKPQSVLITGAGTRVGAILADQLHAAGFDVVIHYRNSCQSAEKLCNRLNARRQNSAISIGIDLQTKSDCQELITRATENKRLLQGIVHNASEFFPTPLATATDQQWDKLINSNFKAAFFLASAAEKFLKFSQGFFINISDINATKPLADFPIYSCAKSGLNALTKSLAIEMAPHVRVNAIAPGTILWPEDDKDNHKKQAEYIANLPLKRMASAKDIAEMALFLAKAQTITGQVIAIDSGASLI